MLAATQAARKAAVAEKAKVAASRRRAQKAKSFKLDNAPDTANQDGKKRKASSAPVS